MHQGRREEAEIIMLAALACYRELPAMELQESDRNLLEEIERACNPAVCKVSARVEEKHGQASTVPVVDHGARMTQAKVEAEQQIKTGKPASTIRMARRSRDTGAFSTATGLCYSSLNFCVRDGLQYTPEESAQLLFMMAGGVDEQYGICHLIALCLRPELLNHGDKKENHAARARFLRGLQDRVVKELEPLLLQHVIASCTDIRYKTREARQTLARMHARSGELHRSAGHYRKALTAYKSCEYWCGLADFYSYNTNVPRPEEKIAQIGREMNNKVHAEQTELIFEINRESALSRCIHFYDAGRNAHIQGDCKQALACYYASLAVVYLHPEPLLKQKMPALLVSMAKASLSLKQYKEADGAALSALMCGEQISHGLRGECYLILDTVARHSGENVLNWRYERAEKCFLAAIAGFKDRTDPEQIRDAVYGHCGLAHMHLNNNQGRDVHNKALARLRLAWGVIDDAGPDFDPVLRQNVLHSLQELDPVDKSSGYFPLQWLWGGMRLRR